MPRPRQRTRRSNARAEDAQTRNLDDLIDFEQFRTEVLPKLREMINKRAPTKDIIAWARPYLTAKQITLALTGDSDAVASSAIKDLLDRSDGKAKETKEHTHRYEQMSDAELEAVLASEEAELQDDVLN